MIVYSYIKKGLAHKNGVCEDSILAGSNVSKGNFQSFEVGDYFLTGVADGVGGQNSGEVASGFTMLRLAELECEKITMEDMRRELADINREVRGMARGNEAYHGMASTLTIFGIVSDGIFFANLGNSRLYQCIERRGIRQLSLETTDHNLINDWIRFGAPDGMNIRDIEGTPKADLLTSYIGMEEELFKRKLEFEELDLSKTIRIFITSDGVHEYVSYEDIKSAICSEDNPRNVLSGLAQKAVDAGSKDDLSIVMIVL